MTKPSDVPQDVWTKAYEAHQMILNTTIPSEAGAILRIARAIAAEREACAQVADTEAAQWDESHQLEASACLGVAAAIRNRT